ncbi:MAG: alkaline phosphatase family protein, partial [Chloroflexota bacterium]
DLPPGGFLRTHVAMELQTVFPSSTASALTSLATGAWPGQHGVTGWWTQLPRLRVAAALLPYTTRPSASGDAVPLMNLGVTSKEVFLTPSTLNRFVKDAVAVFPREIAQGAYSTFFSGGQPRLGYRSTADAVDMVMDRIGRAALPSYTYLYFSEVDERAHRLGRRHGRTIHALRQIDTALGRLALGVGKTARVVVTGDHGMLDLEPRQHHLLVPGSPLLELLECPPSGDARVLFFEVQPGAEDAFRERFLDEYGDVFLLVPVSEAVRLKLFGPGEVRPEVRERLGQFVAISRGADVMEFVPVRPDEPPVLVSHHSGLTPQEMMVPLIVA